MNRSFLNLLTFLIACFALALPNSGLAQTDRVRVTIPGPEQNESGRPTLKRQLQPDGSKRQDSNAQPVIETERCKSESEPASVKADNNVALRFEGLVNVSESDLLKDLHEHRIQLPTDPAQESNFVAKASDRMKEFLVTPGYRYPIVSVRLEQSNARTLVFFVHEGPRPRIAEFRFEGNRIFSTQDLADEVKQCVTRYERDFHNPEVLEYCIHHLDNSARSKGYLQARFYDPKIEETSDGLIITLHVDEGILYRLGEIRIEGSSLLSPETMRKVIPLKTGEIANGERLSEFLYDELKKFYGEHGYIQYTAEVIPEFRSTPDGSAGIVDFALTIDEGQRFRIHKIGFKADGEIPEEQLRQLLFVNEGDVFNQTAFEKSIDRLNETDLFEPIDKDKDVEFGTNDEENLVSIVIRLNKRRQVSFHHFPQSRGEVYPLERDLIWQSIATSWKIC